MPGVEWRRTQRQSKRRWAWTGRRESKCSAAFRRLDLHRVPQTAFSAAGHVWAIKAWQEAKGLSETGYLSREQADALVAGDDEERAEQARIAREKAEREAREKAEREEAERERELWASVRESGDPSDIRTYLGAYPGGVYEELARQRLNTLIAEDDAAYARAEAAGTEAAYEDYLSAYPSGRHVAAAREALARERAALWPGKVFRDCADCPEMVVVPAGTYRMGSPSHEEGRYDDEGPVHEVRIVKPFAVGVHEVTRGQWSEFVTETNHHTGDSCWTYENGEWEERSGRSWRRPGFSQSDGHPVVCVSWDDAEAYVRWMSRVTGEEYRLLSESEWEYVARAGTTTPFHFGATISTEQANYDGNYTYGSGREGVYRERTVPVGSFASNRFGLHDVHGNVWERVQDCWNESYAGAPRDGSAWERGDCSTRVVRGGSWVNGPGYLRSALRVRYSIGDRNSHYGFRIARTLTP